jgi:glucose-6-phosphate 1-dehydrogenase
MDSMTFVLFGASGDLAKRKIFPALYHLFADKKMPRAFSVFGTGLEGMSTAEFQLYVMEAIQLYSRSTEVDEQQLLEFSKTLQYMQLDVTKPEGYQRLLASIQQSEDTLDIPQNRMFYLSVGPSLFEVIAFHIEQSGLGSTMGWRRLVIEKPFGHDLESARRLNIQLNKVFNEDEIYRIDHYLGKSMVQNLATLVILNPVIHAIWNREYIANVQITASETIGVEDRAGYYDQAGAIRDMFQNHMLQMLMMTTMNLPRSISANDIRSEKKHVMGSLRPLLKDEVSQSVIRGQYEHGEIAGNPVVGYIEEPGIAESSTNDTFIATRVWIDNPFWTGVPFYLRTGKRLKEKSTRIVIEFNNHFHRLYPLVNQQAEPNLLVINIGPYEGITMHLNSHNQNGHGKVDPITVEFSADTKEMPEAYELLIEDALQGDSTFFAHWDEVELSWKWVQPILEAFQENSVPLHTYASGTMGPKAADDLLEENGYVWR